MKPTGSALNLQFFQKPPGGDNCGCKNNLSPAEMQGQTALCPELFPADFMGFSRCQKGGLSRICSLVSDSRVRCDDSEKARLEATDPVGDVAAAMPIYYTFPWS